MFLQKYFANRLTSQTFKTMPEHQLLQKLLMFVTLKCNVRSIPSIMSGIRHEMATRLVSCCSVFDNEVLKSVKQGVFRLPASTHRTRVPCTLEMINHIITINTLPAATKWQIMLATGITIGILFVFAIQRVCITNSNTTCR